MQNEWIIRIGKTYQESYQRIQLRTDNWKEAGEIMKILIQLMTYTTDYTVEITLEKAPAGEQQEPKASEEITSAEIVPQEARNVQEL